MAVSKDEKTAAGTDKVKKKFKKKPAVKLFLGELSYALLSATLEIISTKMLSLNVANHP